MSRNGPLALAFHTLFVTFMLAPTTIATRATSSSTATAAPNGQFSVFRNSS